MQKALDFVELRIRQTYTDLEVYRELGPMYRDQAAIKIAVLGELKGIKRAIETFMSVGDYREHADSSTP